MKIACTGHRNLGKEWDGEGPYSDYLRKEVGSVLDELKPSQLITGMALGVDMLCAEVAIGKKIPILCAIPCAGQSKRWPQKSRDRYQEIHNWDKADVVIVSDGDYHPGMMQIRNKYMVDRCDMLLAVYDGSSSGGTKNCIDYAKSIGKKIRYVNPDAWKKTEKLYK